MAEALSKPQVSAPRLRGGGLSRGFPSARLVKFPNRKYTHRNVLFAMRQQRSCQIYDVL
jgi:uncharacterized protein YcsI (UPF0317 family)